MVNYNRAYEKLGVQSNFDSSHAFVTSPIFSPFVLAMFRLSFAFYTLFVNIFALVRSSLKFRGGDAYFSYFTHLSYIGLCAYFWASGVQTLIFAREIRKAYPLQRWPKFLQVMHVILYSTITTFPILVTIMYWAILSGKETFSTPFNAFSNISQHALNTVFAFFEIIFTHAGPSPWLHLPILILFLAGYLGVAYITYADQKFFVYNFLDPGREHGFLAVYIVGVAVAECIIFVVVRGVCVLRERISARESSLSEKEPVPPQGIDEWEEVERPSSV